MTVSLDHAREIERAAHRDLSQHRATGEWFAVGVDLAASKISSLIGERSCHFAAIGNIDEAIGRVISAAIKASGKTQREVAIAAGIDQGNLSRVIAGTQAIPLSRLYPLCDAIGVSVSSITSCLDRDPSFPADRILIPLTPPQRAQALRMLEAFAASIRASN
jgi:transcriptional regulator with XRE-family HTH domain